MTSSHKGFTLIELLVVIAIIAILSVVVVLTLNPAELLRQSRDQNRLSDMDTLTHALSLYQADQGTTGGSGFMGTSTIIYVSLPDASSTCGSWNLPTPPASTTYQCALPSSYRNTNGSGWIPISFSGVSTGNSLGQLPVDPSNSSSTGLYYTYSTNGTQFEVTSLLESAKYKVSLAQNPTIPGYPEVNAKGSNLAVNPLFNPTGLVGYWPMDEGVGSTSGASQTTDQSGNGNNGTWYGTAAGANGTYYTAGKVGSWAGTFTSSSNDYIDLGTNYSQYIESTTATPAATLSSYTLSAWAERTVSTGAQIILGKNGMNAGILDSACVVWDSASNLYVAGYSVSNNIWYMVTMTYTQPTQTAVCYLNGQQVATINMAGKTFAANGSNLSISGKYSYAFNGLIDDARIYNRALSAAEVFALYNADK